MPSSNTPISPNRKLLQSGFIQPYEIRSKRWHLLAESVEREREYPKTSFLSILSTCLLLEGSYRRAIKNASEVGFRLRLERRKTLSQGETALFVCSRVADKREREIDWNTKLPERPMTNTPQNKEVHGMLPHPLLSRVLLFALAAYVSSLHYFTKTFLLSLLLECNRSSDYSKKSLLHLLLVLGPTPCESARNRMRLPLWFRNQLSAHLEYLSSLEAEFIFSRCIEVVFGRCLHWREEEKRGLLRPIEGTLSSTHPTTTSFDGERIGEKDEKRR